STILVRPACVRLLGLRRKRHATSVQRTYRRGGYSRGSGTAEADQVLHSGSTRSRCAVNDRIPSLDGLRAISIAFVFFGHLAGTRGFPLSTQTGNATGLAELGVHVFFVISGYLITRLLLEEIDRNGRIDLRRFYLRRTLRIFPPYYTLLALLFIADIAGFVGLHRHDVLRAMTYTTNYAPDRSWYVGHTWSLSVEEQFYLLWPAVMLLVRPRKAIVVAAAVVLLVPVIRIASWELMRC